MGTGGFLASQRPQDGLEEVKRILYIGSQVEQSNEMSRKMHLEHIKEVWLLVGKLRPWEPKKVTGKKRAGLLV